MPCACSPRPPCFSFFDHAFCACFASFSWSASMVFLLSITLALSTCFWRSAFAPVSPPFLGLPRWSFCCQSPWPSPPASGALLLRLFRLLFLVCLDGLFAVNHLGPLHLLLALCFLGSLLLRLCLLLTLLLLQQKLISALLLNFALALAHFGVLSLDLCADLRKHIMALQPVLLGVLEPALLQSAQLPVQLHQLLRPIHVHTLAVKRHHLGRVTNTARHTAVVHRVRNDALQLQIAQLL